MRITCKIIDKVPKLCSLFSIKAIEIDFQGSFKSMKKNTQTNIM